MTAAALQASAFYSEVAENHLVFTLVADGSFPVLRIDGSDVVPFWSNRSRVDRVRADHPNYASYDVEEIALDDFMAKTLVLLEEEGIRIGVNWSGARLTGYDVAVADMRANLAHQSRHEG